MEEEQLFFWHKQGFIPGPKETEKEFLIRCQQTQKLSQMGKSFFLENKLSLPFDLEKKIPKPLLHWSRHQLLRQYDLSIDKLPAFFSCHQLSFFQGAATWFFQTKEATLPLIQIAKKFEKGSFLKIYSLHETLSHEAIHAARIAFDQNIFEEHFAYSTSNSYLRKTFGPMGNSSREAWFFLTPLFLGSFFKILVFSNFFQLLGSLFLCVSGAFFGFGLFRLGIVRYHFLKSFKKLQKICSSKEKALAIMLRCTDKEIFLFSKSKISSIIEYIQCEKEKSLRWQLISKVYFNIK